MGSLPEMLIFVSLSSSRLAMNAADLRFSSSEFLHLLESQGLTGTWGWTFAADEQVWSPGLFRLLGLDPGSVVPSYGLLTRFVHPDDQDCVESAGEVAADGALGDSIFRVIRPDGSQRILSMRGTVYRNPDGRPRAAAGILLDVTDREQMAASLRAVRRRQWALFELLQSWSNSALYADGQRVASPEILSLTGISQDLFRSDCDRIVAPEERSRMRAEIQARIADGAPFEVLKPLVMADGDLGHFRFLYTPVRDKEGRIETWATHAARTGGPVAPMAGQVQEGLKRSIQGRHLRAARALLGWSMHDLAKAGGISFATVRRLEEFGGPGRNPSHQLAVDALQRAGVGFHIVDGNRIAVFVR